MIYLDLNHYIDLAKAAAQHPDGSQLGEALTACRAAARTGRAVFPLSAAHYMEVAKIKNPRQRHDIAVVMEELSGFTTLLSKDIVMRLELEAV